jgi:hypothetical protein
MRNLLATALAVGLAAGIATPVLAGGKNWTQDKIDQVNQNRLSNAGVGNGGEDLGDPSDPNDDTVPNISGEDFSDDDPGNSGQHNQAGKNDKVDN